MRGSPKRAASSVIDSSLVGSQDDDRVVELFEGLECVCGNAEDGGQHSGGKHADGLADADVVFGFGRADVLDDHYLHVGRAAVLEVVEGTLGCEHDVADMLVEALMVAVPVDDHPTRDSAGDDVELPRAGMPVRLADTPGHQRELHDAGRLAFEYRKIVLVRLLKPAPVVLVDGRIAEMEQVRFRGNRLSGQPGITKACRAIGQWLFPISAIAGDKPVSAYTGRRCYAGQARSTQDHPTI